MTENCSGLTLGRSGTPQYISGIEMQPFLRKKACIGLAQDLKMVNLKNLVGLGKHRIFFAYFVTY